MKKILERTPSLTEAAQILGIDQGDALFASEKDRITVTSS